MYQKKEHQKYSFKNPNVSKGQSSKRSELRHRQSAENSNK